jgi:hypothetical protein
MAVAEGESGRGMARRGLAVGVRCGLVCSGPVGRGGFDPA